MRCFGLNAGRRDFTQLSIEPLFSGRDMPLQICIANHGYVYDFFDIL
jgi:hypothetical protein